jgi:3-dehydroquinate synthase
MRSTLVGLGDRQYPVVVAPTFAGLGAAIPLSPGRCVVVTNPVVGALYAEPLLGELRSAGWNPSVLLIPDGESHKTLETWEDLLLRLLPLVDRKTPVIALGGGVTGDLVGFAAATALRGVPFVQVPTTLLAMVDASVGGKTGVNVAAGKNLVGAFYQPILVWAALSTLTTLPDSEFRCGLGEVVKHAVIAGDSALHRCETTELLDRSTVGALVTDSVTTKARIVEADERENGQRALLNLGHTLGHAVEAVAGFGTVAHGEAVALGMLGVTAFAGSRGWLSSPDLFSRLHTLFGRLGLPQKLPFSADPDALARAVGFDKKRARGTLSLVVPEAPGRVVLRALPLEEIPALVDALLRLG